MEITIDTKNITSWDDGVSIGTDYKSDLDVTHLNLGILANVLCPIRMAGGQSKENPLQTISALAVAIGIDRPWLSNAANNAQFFEGYFPDLPPQASIQDLSRARGVTGSL